MREYDDSEYIVSRVKSEAEMCSFPGSTWIVFKHKKAIIVKLDTILVTENIFCEA